MSHEGPRQVPAWVRVAGAGTFMAGSAFGAYKVHEAVQQQGGPQEIVAAWHPEEQAQVVVCDNPETGDWHIEGSAQSSEAGYDAGMSFSNVSVTPAEGATVAENVAATNESQRAKIRVNLIGGVARVVVKANTTYPGAPNEAGDDDNVKFEGEKPEGCEPTPETPTTPAPTEAPVVPTAAPTPSTIAGVVVTTPSTTVAPTARTTVVTAAPKAKDTN